MDFFPSVVVHFKNGDLKKGYTHDFAFYREVFSLTEVDSQTKEEREPVDIKVEDLKAVFFVKDFDGDPQYRPDLEAERYGFGDRVEVTFHDKETLVGYTPRYKENNNGFILYPADSETNNAIIAVIRSAARSIKAEKKHSYFSF